MTAVELRARHADVPALDLLGVVARVARDPLAGIAHLVATRGDIVHLRVAGRHVVLIGHPEAAQHVLVQNAASYTRVTGLFPGTARFFGASVLTTEGEAWRRYRRLAQPAFQREHLLAYCEHIPGAMAGLEARWDEAASTGATLVPFHEMSRVSLTIVGKSIFGGSARVPLERMLAAFETGQRHMARRLRLPEWLPTPGNRALRQALADLDAVLYGLIAEARAQREAHEETDAGDTPFLRALMSSADDETRSTMTDRELRDALLTFFGAGYDTTASVLSWALIHLGADASLQERVRAEVLAVAPARALGPDDVPRLPLVTRVLEEAMRLWPPIWMIARKALAADVLVGRPIPAGAYCFVSPFLAHRREADWVEPGRFLPERFENLAPDARSRGCYFPFGMGGHKCIGSVLAMLEMPLVLGSVLRRYRLRVDEGTPLLGLARFTLAPSPHIRLTVSPR